ncbi:MAG: GNAT family N-acetyltransferase [Bacteroidota bacterium]
MNILQQQNETKGSFYVEQNGKVVAEMTYSVASPSLIIIDHTEVDESLKGKGAGVKLLNKLVEYARANNIKIIPLCPFAKSVFDKKHEEFKDVLRQ